MDVLAGSVERVTFHSAETGFCVLKVHARVSAISFQWWGTRPPSPPASG